MRKRRVFESRNVSDNNKIFDEMDEGHGISI
jgi:hypothetical protein